jgi:preprotein translocase subunit SecA
LPGLLFGEYPEQRVGGPDLATRMSRRLRAKLGRTALGSRKASERLLAGMLRADAVARGTPDAQRLHALRARLPRDGFSESTVAEAFCVIGRMCQHTLGLTPRATQLLAARILLDNRLAEMATGEGKTLAAALAAATAALVGIPVHVVTANEYLAARDRDHLAPLYAALGLSAGCVLSSMDYAARRRVYDHDIVYCTAKELVFDYLRDRLLRDPGRSFLEGRTATLGSCGTSRIPVLRGLCMAILDEADSILLDEARTPLILSQPVTNAGQVRYHHQTLALARELNGNTDYAIEHAEKQIRLTERGRDRLDGLTARLTAEWHNRMHRDEVVCVALAALHLYERDRDYLLREGKVIIIDQVSGRAVPGRVWSRGLHTMVELKENCAVTAEQATAAKITYQRFFPRYLRLCGMSGTLHEARAELAAIYGLGVTRIPLLRPCRRHVLPTRLYRCRVDQWLAVLARVRELTMEGRPVLIGTDSVLDSAGLSEALTHAGVVHQVLNAVNDSVEASIVATAGQPGAVTVATNMAGRGTDIVLAPEVAELGGLHVISCQHNASRRIDRQLMGRCSRQGDPGSTERMLAIEQPLLSRYLPAWLRRALARSTLRWPRAMTSAVVLLPQLLEEHRHRQQRLALQRYDANVERELDLGGIGE